MIHPDSKKPRPAEPNEANLNQEKHSYASPDCKGRLGGDATKNQQKEPRAGTQLRTILELLKSRQGAWVGVNEIMRAAHCAAAHSAISTLRQRYGLPIENRMQRGVGAIMHSEYRLKEVPR